jgi:8-oxo-dGTP pyrophosphatase MutT (NUDIX family)
MDFGKMKIEQLVFVDDSGMVRRFSATRTQGPGEYIAVVLVLVYLPTERKLLLFNRGVGASDMRDHWALTAGKLNTTDFSEPLDEAIGNKVSAQTVRKSASREFVEELNIAVQPERFEHVIEFHMPNKNLFFTLLAWPIGATELAAISPDGAEVDALKLFTLDEFRENEHLGDAIVFKKREIISYLESHFSHR